MALDPQLSQQFRQVLSMQVSSGTANIYGEIAGGSTATAYCRLEQYLREIETQDGTFPQTKSRVFLDAGSPTPTFSMWLWLPGDSPSTPSLAKKIENITPCIDENGNLEHWEVIV